MKFSIERDVFADALACIQGVSNPKATLPILSTCLVTADKDGKVSIRGDDMDISIDTYCRATEVEKPGSVAISAKRLFDTAKSAPAGVVKVVEGKGHWCEFLAGNVRARIAGMNGEDFPKSRVSEATFPVSLPASKMAELIERTFFAISSDESRAAFTGALFSIADGAAMMVATDGHRLSKAFVGVDGQLGPVIVPKKGMGELRRLLQRGGDVKLDVCKDDLVAQVEHAVMTVRLIPGRFPNFELVIPKKTDHTVTIARQSLVAALKRVSLFAPKTGTVRMSLSDERAFDANTMMLDSFDQDSNECSESLPCSYKGNGVVVGFNYRYLLDALAVMHEDEVKIAMIDDQSPTVLTSNDSSMHVVMPLQL